MQRCVPGAAGGDLEESGLPGLPAPGPDRGFSWGLPDVRSQVLWGAVKGRPGDLRGRPRRMPAQAGADPGQGGGLGRRGRALPARGGGGSRKKRQGRTGTLPDRRLGWFRES
jgi:hypothetical protein